MPTHLPPSSCQRHRWRLVEFAAIRIFARRSSRHSRHFIPRFKHSLSSRFVRGNAASRRVVHRSATIGRIISRRIGVVFGGYSDSRSRATVLSALRSTRPVLAFIPIRVRSEEETHHHVTLFVVRGRSDYFACDRRKNAREIHSIVRVRSRRCAIGRARLTLERYLDTSLRGVNTIIIFVKPDGTVAPFFCDSFHYYVLSTETETKSLHCDSQ